MDLRCDPLKEENDASIFKAFCMRMSLSTMAADPLSNGPLSNLPIGLISDGELPRARRGPFLGLAPSQPRLAR